LTSSLPKLIISTILESITPRFILLLPVKASYLQAYTYIFYSLTISTLIVYDQGNQSRNVFEKYPHKTNIFPYVIKYTPIMIKEKMQR
jgi:hypothetical protein